MTSDRSPLRRIAPAFANLRIFCRDRRGAVALMFGLAAIPLALLVGLAIDFAFISQARAQLDLAADTAALTAAKTAGAAFTAQQANYLTLGQQAGVAWFTAQVGSIPDAILPTPKAGTNPTVVLQQQDNAFTATVSYTAQVTTIFHKLFGISYVTLSNTSAAKIVANAYVNVSFLLDNSSSMLIAANASDITALQNATANSSTWQLTGNPGCTGSTRGTQGPYKVTVSTPAAATGARNSASYPGSNDFGINSLPGCQCAFACHWQPLTGSTFTTGTTTFSAVGVDTLAGAPNSGQTTQTYTLDYYGIARWKGIQLRFDVVQSAVATAIGYMKDSELIANQFGAEVFEFANTLTKDWPPPNDTTNQALADGACLNSTDTPCSNGNAQAAAAAISSPVVYDSANTNFPAIMASLYTQERAELTSSGLTAAGDGSTQAKAKRSLIIITDGIQDWGGRRMVNGYSLGAGTSSNPSGAEGPISLNDCAALKSLGYTIYVLYTTYITTPATVVLNNTTLVPYVNSTTGTAYDLKTNLQGCASDPTNYAEASVPADIQTALQSMVRAALNGGARLTL